MHPLMITGKGKVYEGCGLHMWCFGVLTQWGHHCKLSKSLGRQRLPKSPYTS